MNKATASAVLVLSVLLSGCAQNTPSSPPTTADTQSTPSPQPTTQTPSQKVRSTQTSGTTTDAVPATPSQKASLPPTATETPSPDITQEAIPGEVDQPAQQYEAKQGEHLQSNLSARNISAATMHDFLRTTLEDVHGYWSDVWAGAGYVPPTVNYTFPMPGESYPAPPGCGPSNDATAGYCSLDDTIIISQALATDVWNGQVKLNADPETGIASGDFSVAFVVAHEYAHNLQAELGLVPDELGEARLYPAYKTELHADCWAGIWANSAYYKGYLEGTDVEEAQQAGRLAGDYSVTDPQHHGTPQQRVDAFMSGYNTGTPTSCDPWLLESY